jgi:hypothetical protein
MKRVKNKERGKIKKFKKKRMNLKIFKFKKSLKYQNILKKLLVKNKTMFLYIRELIK